MERKTILLLTLCIFLFSSIVFPYTLSGQVRSSSNVMLIGTTVEASSPIRAVASTVAGIDGRYSLTLENGTYFVVFRRQNYPDNVQLLAINSDMERNVVIVQNRQCIYGTVKSTQTLAGKEIYLLRGGLVYSKTAMNENGQYVFSSVPADSYEIEIKAPGSPRFAGIIIAEKISLKYDIDLTKITQGGEEEGGAIEEGYSLSVPEIIQPGQTIIATLLIGSRPAIGEKILVQTPIGNVTRTTNTRGQVNLVALDEGNYRFNYKEFSYRVVSTSNPNPEPTAPSETGQPPPSEQTGEGAGAQITEEKNDAAMIYLLAGGALVAFTLLALLLLAIAKARKGKKGHKGKEEEKGTHAQKAKKREEEKGIHAHEAKKEKEEAKGIYVQHDAVHEEMEITEKKQEEARKKEKRKAVHTKGKKKGKFQPPKEGEVSLENYFSQ